MFRYYLELSLREFRKSPGYAAVAVLVLGLGVGLVMTVLALAHVLGGDPLPDRSDRLLHPTLSANLDNPDAMDVMPSSLVERLRRALPGTTLVAGGYGYGGVDGGDGRHRGTELVRFTDAGFFGLFDVPMLRGRAWTAAEAADGAPLAVVGAGLARELFGTVDAVGRDVAIAGTRFRIVGVAGDWRPVPRFYDLSVGAYSAPERVFVPVQAVRSLEGDLFLAKTCPRDAAVDFPAAQVEGSRCAWLNAWLSADGDGARRDVETAAASVASEWNAGRQGGAALQVRVESLRELLRRSAVVPGGIWLGALLAGCFLLLCMVNAAGLALAKGLRRSGEIGIRRALGASRRQIVLQMLTEQGLMGLASSAVGALVAWGGVWLVRQMPDPALQLATLDPVVLSATLGVAVLVGVGSGLFPAWRASGVEPAIQVKVE